MKADASEERILAMLLSEPDKAFSLIVEKYASKLYWHIRRLVIIHDDADDVLQNTFISVWKNLSQFRKDSSLYTWLYSIATNEALSHIKKREKQTGLPLDDLENIFAFSPESETWFDGDEAMIKLQNAILKLPEKQKIVFNLKYFDDISYEEMSKITGTSVGALKASYHHAVKKIENFLMSD